MLSPYQILKNHTGEDLGQSPGKPEEVKVQLFWLGLGGGILGGLKSSSSDRNDISFHSPSS